MKKLIVRAYGLWLNSLAHFSPQRASEKAFLTFCRPWRLPITERQHHFFNTANKFVMECEGGSVQCYRWGRGDKRILFLHGWQSHTYRWKMYIESLAGEEYTVYAFDAPGHGLTTGNFLSVPLYSDIIESFIREHGPFESVVAHSVGGFSLLYALYRYPLLPVNRIVLMAPPGEASEFVEVFRSELKLSRRVVELLISHFLHKYDVAPEYFSIERFAENLKLPGLIVHDVDDPDAPYEHAVRLNKVWQRSSLITTRGLGHSLKSTDIVRQVEQFVRDASGELVGR